MEDQCLRCNNRLENGGICRKELKESAIVTTCSHVVCTECAAKTGFTVTHIGERQCPVCTQPLQNVDDAAEMNLRPTEEYKTSVLCGLDPTTIMECASSALSFWNYQMLQETAYQQHLLLALSKKYSSLNDNVNQMAEQANGEIHKLHERMTAMNQDNQILHKKNVELAENCRERGKKYSELRKGYEALKKIVQQGHQSSVTEEGAEHAIRDFTDNHVADALNRTDSGRPTINIAAENGTPSMQRQFTSRFYPTKDLIPPLPHQQRQGSADRRSTEALRMPPPPPPTRPSSGHGILPLNMPSQNRTPLTSAYHFPADRTQISGSANRAIPLQPFGPPGSSLPSSFRNHVPANASHNRHYSTRSFGGITAGMKAGVAQTDAQIRQQSGYVPSRGYSHRQTGSTPNASQYF